jgi:hypothetical protein
VYSPARFLTDTSYRHLLGPDMKLYIGLRVTVISHSATHTTRLDCFISTDALYATKRFHTEVVLYIIWSSMYTENPGVFADAKMYMRDVLSSECGCGHTMKAASTKNVPCTSCGVGKRNVVFTVFRLNDRPGKLRIAK